METVPDEGVTRQGLDSGQLPDPSQGRPSSRRWRECCASGDDFCTGEGARKFEGSPFWREGVRHPRRSTRRTVGSFSPANTCVVPTMSAHQPSSVAATLRSIPDVIGKALLLKPRPSSSSCAAGGVHFLNRRPVFGHRWRQSIIARLSRLAQPASAGALKTGVKPSPGPG